jgi:hypothetical protein
MMNLIGACLLHGGSVGSAAVWPFWCGNSCVIKFHFVALIRKVRLSVLSLFLVVSTFDFFGHYFLDIY